MTSQHRTPRPPLWVRAFDRFNAWLDRWLDRCIASEVGGDVWPPKPEADR